LTTEYDRSRPRSVRREFDETNPIEPIEIAPKTAFPAQKRGKARSEPLAADETNPLNPPAASRHFDFHWKPPAVSV
jgi:hypothetical protein